MLKRPKKETAQRVGWDPAPFWIRGGGQFLFGWAAGDSDIFKRVQNTNKYYALKTIRGLRKMKARLSGPSQKRNVVAKSCSNTDPVCDFQKVCAIAAAL